MVAFGAWNSVLVAESVWVKFPRVFEYQNQGMFKIRKRPELNGPYMCQGLNSHYFHIIGDGHQPNSRGLYTH